MLWYMQSHRASHHVHPDSEVRQILSPVPKGRPLGGSSGHLHVSASPGTSAAVPDVCVHTFMLSIWLRIRQRQCFTACINLILCCPLIANLVVIAAVVSLTDVTLSQKKN